MTALDIPALLFLLSLKGYFAFLPKRNCLPKQGTAKTRGDTAKAVSRAGINIRNLGRGKCCKLAIRGNGEMAARIAADQSAVFFLPPFPELTVIPVFTICLFRILF